MTLAIETDMSSCACNSTFTETFGSLVKAALFMGIFCCAMKSLEAFFGTIPNGECPAFDLSDSDETNDYDLRRIEEIQVPSTTKTELNLVEFAKENVLEATTVIEEKEEEKIPEYVIGAEDLVDHINRMIG